MAVKNIVAVDLGASSGRVMLATLHTATQHLTLKEIHRFSNTLVFQDNHHQWDLAALERDILTGYTKSMPWVSFPIASASTVGASITCYSIRTDSVSACRIPIATTAPMA